MYFSRTVWSMQTLLTNIPVLGTLECMTSGRKLFLVDNPGVGDSNEDANLLPDLSLKTSQAFVYMLLRWWNF